LGNVGAEYDFWTGRLASSGGVNNDCDEDDVDADDGSKQNATLLSMAIGADEELQKIVVKLTLGNALRNNGDNIGGGVSLSMSNEAAVPQFKRNWCGTFGIDSGNWCCCWYSCNLSGTWLIGVLNCTTMCSSNKEDPSHSVPVPVPIPIPIPVPATSGGVWQRSCCPFNVQRSKFGVSFVVDVDCEKNKRRFSFNYI